MWKKAVGDYFSLYPSIWMAGLSKPITDLRIAGSMPRFEASTSKMQDKGVSIEPNCMTFFSSYQLTQHMLFDFNMRQHTVLFVTMNSTSHHQPKKVKSTIHYKLFVWRIDDEHQLLLLGLLGMLLLFLPGA